MSEWRGRLYPVLKLPPSPSAHPTRVCYEQLISAEAVAAGQQWLTGGVCPELLSLVLLFYTNLPARYSNTISFPDRKPLIRDG